MKILKVLMLEQPATQVIGYVSPKFSRIDAAPYSNIFPTFIIQITI